MPKDNTIIILDKDETRSDFFQSMFMRDDYEVKIFNTIKSCIDFISESGCIAALVEYDTLVDEERDDVILFFKNFNRNNIFVFNVPVNANKRLAFYELGARHVFDQKSPHDEIYYALTWPVKNLSLSFDKDRFVSSGNLEDLSLTVLLNNLGREERSGILKLITEKNSGKIYFRNGQIIHAQTRLLEGDKALIHMLFWNSGTFSFSAAAHFNKDMTVMLSSFGLVILAEQLKHRYLSDINNIGSFESTLQLQYIGDLQNTQFNLQPGFVKLLSRPITFKDALENDYYPSFETARILSDLKNANFLSVVEYDKKELTEEAQTKKKEPVVSDVEHLFDLKSAEQLIDNLNLPVKGNRNLLILSTKGISSGRFLTTILGKEPNTIKKLGLKLGILKFSDQLNLTCYSSSIHKSILAVIEKLSFDLCGIIFIIDNNVPEKFEYLKYVSLSLQRAYPLPFLPVVANTKSENETEEIRKIFNIHEVVPVPVFENDNLDIVKNIFLQLKEYEIPEETEDEEEKETQEQEETKEISADQ